MKFVESGAATERERVVQDRVGEDLDQRPADDQVLLDLKVVRPRRLLAPFEDEVAWNHRSAFTRAFT